MIQLKVFCDGNQFTPRQTSRGLCFSVAFPDTNNYQWQYSMLLLETRYRQSRQIIERIQQQSRGLRPFFCAIFIQPQIRTGRQMREKSRVLRRHQSKVKHDRLGNLDWDLEIRISDLQQNAKSKKRIWALTNISLDFLSFFRFYREICWKWIWKTVLKNSNLPRARIIK